MTQKINAYIQGNIRYKLYYTWFSFLIPRHIREQIDWRINHKMDKTCFDQGSCILCGCETPALQMANIACDKPCYPEMMDKDIWRWFKKANNINV